MCLGVIGNQDRRQSCSFLPHHPPFSPERYAWCQPTTSPIHMVESDKSASYAAEPSGKPPRPADVVAAIRGFAFSRRRSSCVREAP